MTAGGYNNLFFFLFYKLFVFAFYNCRAYRRFLGSKKSELFERFFKRINTRFFKISGKRRRNGSYYLFIPSQKNLYILFCVNYFLGVLRTYNKTLTAKYTVIGNDMCLVSRKSYRLYRTVSYTFIAVLAI